MMKTNSEHCIPYDPFWNLNGLITIAYAISMHLFYYYRFNKDKETFANDYVPNNNNEISK